MDNQHRAIQTYRELSQGEIDLMNEVKAHEAEGRRLVKRLQALPEIDQRCCALAVTHLELYSMYGCRAIARPVLPE